MGKKTISTPQVIVNNVVYPIIANSLTYTEGFGEYTMKGTSVGSGKTEVIFSENAENKMSKVTFELPPTLENIKTARAWKALLNDNAVEFSDEGFNRTFTNMALVNDYEVKLGGDTTIALEFMGDPAV